MGVVFSVFFAAGVYLMQQVARNVDLDADCVLYGQLEGLIWIMPGAPLAPESLAQIPRQVVTLGIVLLLAIGFVIAFYKELRISSFDPELATSLGFRASWISSALLVLIAAATVASFEAVGSILVIAMLICPAATARMFTDRLRTQLLLSVTLAILSATAGYALAALLPSWIGISGSLSAAGMITVTAGMFFTLAAIAAPAHGILPRMMHRRTLARRVDLEDLLGTLYRLGESGHERPSAAAIAGARLNSGRIQAALESAERSGFVHRSADGIGLTERGSAIAGALVRRHRLWERYLVDRAGFSPDHVHDPAEQLEHLVDLESERPVTGAPLVDPHGRFIPPRADPNG